MTYTRQLLVSFLLAALALVRFLMATYALPNTGPGETQTTPQIVLTGIVVLGILISGILALSFGTAAIMWRINGGEPDRTAMPLGARIKGAGIIFVVAMLAYASFFFI